METHNYLKYVFSSFLGREEEKPVSKKIYYKVHNSPSEPRSSFHPSSRSDCSPGKFNTTPSVQPRETLAQSQHLMPDPDQSQPGQKSSSKAAGPRKHFGWGSSSCNEFWRLTTPALRKSLEQRKREKSDDIHMGGTGLLSTIVEEFRDMDG